MKAGAASQQNWLDKYKRMLLSSVACEPAVHTQLKAAFMMSNEATRQQGADRVYLFSTCWQNPAVRTPTYHVTAAATCSSALKLM
jgi:hypothetical protein